MRVRKAVIPAAGLGTRFLPATKAQPKAMLPVIDVPAIQLVVEEAVRAGLEDVLIVAGRGQSSIEDHFDRSPELEAFLQAKGKTAELEAVRAIADLAQVHVVRQREALGLGHAVAVAEAHVGDEPFAVLLGDDLIDPRVPLLPRMLDAFAAHGRTVVATMEVGPREIAMYGCIEPAPTEEPADGSLVRIASVVEKPDPAEAPSNLGVIGRYVFTPSVFDALRRTGPGHGGEIQVTDAINLLAAEEGAVALRFTEGRFDVGNPLDALKATVELAVVRDDLGPAFTEWLRAFVARDGAPGGPG
jgi:UTP--glucose-1-phosphate uridylyltransferase